MHQSFKNTQKRDKVAKIFLEKREVCTHSQLAKHLKTQSPPDTDTDYSKAIGLIVSGAKQHGWLKEIQPKIYLFT